MSHQSIVQNELADRRVEKIRDRMAMQIDHKYPPSCNTAHLTKNVDHLLVEKVVRKQRAHHIVKLCVTKRKTECIATARADLIELLRLFQHRLRHTLIQLKPNCAQLSIILPRP